MKSGDSVLRIRRMPDAQRASAARNANGSYDVRQRGRAKAADKCGSKTHAARGLSHSHEPRSGRDTEER